MTDVYAGLEPLEINPGGIVQPADLVGRDELVAALLAHPGAGVGGGLLLGDRRIGKTSVLGAIEEQMRQVGHLVVRVSAETNSLATFSNALLAAMRRSKLQRWNIDLDGEAVVNVGVASITLRTKAARGRASAPQEQDLFELVTQAVGRNSQHKAVFLFDEITVLATSLAKQDREDAREFLRSLRRARQSSGGQVVMYYAGSIGLHHAVPDDTEVNDLVKHRVGVLDDESAVLLAKRVLASAQPSVTSLDDVAGEMARITSGFPYFIHGLAQSLVTRPGAAPIAPQDVRDAFNEAMLEDRWNVRHYDVRIDEYYEADATLVRDLLDAIALAPDAISVDELMQSAAIARHEPNRAQVINLLERLERDHYIKRSSGGVEMAHDMIGRFWIHLRRLQ